MDDPTQNEKEYRPATYTHNIFVKLVGLGCMLLFGLCSAVSFLQMWEDKVDVFTAVAFPAFAILGLVLFLWMSTWWTVREDGIAVRSWYGREEIHYWIDLDSVESTGLGSGIRIKDKFGKTVLSLDPWIWKYDEFVELLRLHKPELFEQKSDAPAEQNVRVLKRNPIIYPLGLLFSLVLIGPGIRGLLEGDLFGLPLALLGGLIVYLMLRIPSAVHLLEDRLRFTYLIGERTVHVEEIYNIYPKTALDVQGGAGASAIVELAGGRKIELSGFREGTPAVVNVLRNWWEAYLKAHPRLEEEGIPEDDTDS
jgi:hypothetical protein